MSEIKWELKSSRNSRGELRFETYEAQNQLFVRATGGHSITSVVESRWAGPEVFDLPQPLPPPLHPSPPYNTYGERVGTERKKVGGGGPLESGSWMSMEEGSGVAPSTLPELDELLSSAGISSSTIAALTKQGVTSDLLFKLDDAALQTAGVKLLGERLRLRHLAEQYGLGGTVRVYVQDRRLKTVLCVGVGKEATVQQLQDRIVQEAVAAGASVKYKCNRLYVGASMGPAYLSPSAIVRSVLKDDDVVIADASGSKRVGPPKLGSKRDAPVEEASQLQPQPGKSISRSQKRGKVSSVATESAAIDEEEESSASIAEESVQEESSASSSPAQVEPKVRRPRKFKGKIGLIIGGSLHHDVSKEEIPLRNVFEADLEDLAFRKAAEIPTSLSHAVAAQGWGVGSVIIAGGIGASGDGVGFDSAQNVCYIRSAKGAGVGWEVAAVMPQKLSHAAAVTVGDTMYVAGGSSGAGSDPLKSVLCFSRSGLWSSGNDCHTMCTHSS